jgi:hypothetical protein
MKLRLYTTLLIATYAANAWTAPCFDDKNLNRAAHRKTLVYVWSPRMVLSAQHASAAQQQAQQMGLAFIALHDAQVPQAELSAAMQRMQHSDNTTWQRSASALQHSQALCAPTLLQRDALRHFPTAFVLQGGSTGAVVHRHPIVGAMPDAAWASSLALRVQQMQDTQSVQAVQD